mmetsp:Transcript_44810/g.43408  ORF Transcript_44810/g.43408 Transcript_44810/m.43408 type:complete len:155 (+) Transcript_44810:363-827(+)
MGKNPHNQERSCGGSTGGDAGLSAARCALFGIGTDVGGSVRIPCHFNGVRGIKLTSERVSRKLTKFATERSFNPYPIMNFAISPLAPSMEDLKVVTKTLLTGNVSELDTLVVPGYFNEEMYLNVGIKKMRVGFYDSLEVVPSTRAMKRAMALAK